MTDEHAGSPELLQTIRDEIAANGPMSFARFMELALYHPSHGYYAAGPDRLGRRGDFFTASDVGTALGRCLAVQLLEMDERLGGPDPFEVLEFGGGRGWLARDVLDHVAGLSADLARRVRYTIVDRSAAMRNAAAARVPEASVVPAVAAGEAREGCVLAVELFDALPVHRVRRRQGRLIEVCVDVDSGGRLTEVECAPCEDAAALATRYGAAPRDDDESEVCAVARNRLDDLARSIGRGFLLVIDYGYPAEELYGRAHNRGTLLAYHRHRTNEDYLSRVGRQDLTAHVNFTALADRACEGGLDLLGLTTQDRFLIANGALAPFEETDDARWREPARVRERLRVLQLVHPDGMGRIFKVLALSKNVRPLPRLHGLADPFNPAS